MPVYWLSLAPEDGEARVCIVEAESFMAANAKRRALRLSVPGAEVFGFPIPEYEPEYGLPRDRFLTEEELLAINTTTLGAELDREFGPKVPE